MGALSRASFLLGLLIMAAACTSRSNPDSDWPGYGNDPAEQRFSPLSEINADNVSRLGLQWSLDLPGEIALEATPIEVGGFIYFSGSFATVYAVDAVSGKLLWRYDPKANEETPQALRLVWAVNRGVAYADGKLFVATRDARMIALDAKSGKPVWISSFSVPGVPASSTGAPRVFKNKVIIGNSGSETGGRGYVTAFDVKTGRMAWRFFTVPGDPSKGFENDAMAMAAKTWSGEWWKYGGGGTPWNAITFDAELNQVYVGTGNSGPFDWRVRAKRPGDDNLFLTSIVALDADTGQYKWHYQYNPREAWDWKATSDIILTTLTLGGRPRKVLMQAPSNGFFYVIDRENGKLISAKPIGKQNWAERIDLASGRPVEKPGIRYENGPFTIYPNNEGAHNWQAMSFSPRTGLVYIPYQQEGGFTYSITPTSDADLKSDMHRYKLRFGVNRAGYRDPKDPRDGTGSLLAWDPAAQKLRWRVDYPVFLNAGTMVTAGNLVFQGNNTGQFFAYDARTGKRLWSFDAKLGIISPPISFSVRGRQYVSLLVGYGGTGGAGGPGRKQGWKFGLQPRRLLTFALDGNAKLPPTAAPDFSINALDDPTIRLDPANVALGQRIYESMTCMVCHGGGADATGNAPDLRESGIALNKESLRTLLRDGSLVSRGMPKFDDLTDAEIEGVFQYIRDRARAARQENPVAAQQRSGGL
uniref:Quino(Hemo)protein alcohol dehydrogenase, PQQ-dependent n=2 Tax=Sphingomonas sp. JE1 TaxID=1628059 RepID=A0A0D4ZZP5_9SPHN|nr:Quino(hemo)protein alcohol dehydrogenase, PQQ-dependent [Sphingomonas sp. JE1]